MSILRQVDFIFNFSLENIFMSLDPLIIISSSHFSEFSLMELCTALTIEGDSAFSAPFPWYWNKGSPFCLFFLALSVPPSPLSFRSVILQRCCLSPLSDSFCVPSPFSSLSFCSSSPCLLLYYPTTSHVYTDDSWTLITSPGFSLQLQIHISNSQLESSQDTLWTL